MVYLLTIIAALLAVLVAALLVATPATLLSLIPRPMVRKWIVICIGLFIAFHLVLLCLFVVIFKPDISTPFRFVAGRYHDLPSTTLLHAVPAVVGVLSIVVFAIWAFLPEKGEPYQPRGVPWSFGWLLKRIGLLVALFIVSVVIQDFELRWRLNNLEARADQMAESLKLPAVPDADNAAIHYERIAAMMEKPEFQNDESEHVDKLLNDCSPMDDEATAYFKRYEPIRAELEAAAKCTQCRFSDATIPKSLVDETPFRIHESSAFIHLYQFARLQICQQRPSEAIKCIRILQAWHRHLQADSRRVDATHFRHVSSLVLKLVQSLVTNCRTIPTEELRSIVVAPLPLDEIHQAALRWEEMVSFKTIALTFDGRIYESPRLQVQHGPSTNSWRDKITRVLMRLLFARDDLTAIQAQYACLETPYDKTTWKHAGCDRELQPRGQLTPRLTSMMVLRQFFAMAEGERRLANIAIAAALYRQDHGSWPSDLKQLAPKYIAVMPHDPQTDTPFAFKAIDNGLVVWANQSTEHLEEAESEGKFWEATSQTYAPILLLGDALRLSEAFQQSSK